MAKNSAKCKPRIMDDITFNNIFFDNDEACRNFFLNVFHPIGLVCPECGCTHFTLLNTRNNVYTCSHCSHQICLFAGTIFQDNKLSLYKLLYGIFLFITSKKGISAEELSSKIHVNRKTGQLLNRKLRYLIELDNMCDKLESAFIEMDGFFIGGKSSNGKRGLGTDQQSFIMALGTNADNNYPTRVKIIPTQSENKEEVKVLLKQIKYDKNTTFTTDDKNTYNFLGERAKLQQQIIDYDDKDHPLYWLNKSISNLKSNIDGIYHGIAKKYLNEYVQEYAWRFNHRYKGSKLMLSMNRILGYKVVMTRKMLRDRYNALAA